MAMIDLVDEKFFLPRLMALQECLCAELEKANGPKLCFCGIVPAGRPPLGLMSCKTGNCGVAWVAPIGTYPVGAFPLPAETTTPLARCALPTAMRVQVGVARCYPRPPAGQTGLDPQDTFNATRLYMSDMAAAKRALLCCFPEASPNRGDYQVSVESWEAMDPEASASGGIWTAVIG